MIEAEKEALEHVAMALGVPWSRLSASGRTFDNAPQEDRTYWHDTVLPRHRPAGRRQPAGRARRGPRSAGSTSATSRRCGPPRCSRSPTPSPATRAR